MSVSASDVITVAALIVAALALRLAVRWRRAYHTERAMYDELAQTHDKLMETCSQQQALLHESSELHRRAAKLLQRYVLGRVPIGEDDERPGRVH